MTTTRPPSLETLLILDLETTGLSPEQHRCIELGAVLFSVSLRTTLSQVSTLFPVDRNPAQWINRISPEASQRPQPWQQTLELFQVMVQYADVAVAHNVSFDRRWFGRPPLPALTLPWVCTCRAPWPSQLGLRTGRVSLKDLARAHGVRIGNGHRALADCAVLAQILARCHDLEALLLASLGRPKPHGQGRTSLAPLGKTTTNQARRKRIQPLGSSGAEQKTPSSAGPLAGQTFVLTGTLASLSRAEAQQRIEAAGGTVTSSVSKKTTHLVVGANPGSKLAIARAFGLVILDEAALLQRLDHGSTSPRSIHKRSQGPLAGQTFVLTGTLASLSHAEAQQRIEAAGGTVTSSVSKKTTHLVVGANPGSKLTVARAFGLMILDEAALLQRLDHGSTSPRSIHKRSQGPLAGQTFVLTGTLASLSHAEAQQRIEAAGGTVTSSVSKKTTHLVVGANPGSKLTVARAFGLVILDEAALLQHLESAPT